MQPTRMGGSMSGRLWLAVILLPALVSSCGGSTVTVTDRAAAPSTGPIGSTTSATTTPTNTRPNNPAQQPDPNVTAYCNEVPIGHACHAVTNTPSDPNESPQRNCDTNIVANSQTSCELAENAFYEAYQSGDSGRKSFAIEAY